MTDKDIDMEIVECTVCKKKHQVVKETNRSIYFWVCIKCTEFSKIYNGLGVQVHPLAKGAQK